MRKIQANIVDYVVENSPDLVVLPISSYRKKDGSIPMGAGALRLIAERIYEAPNILGAAITSPTAFVTNVVQLRGVRVCGWVIQPEMGFKDDVYGHLQERFADANADPDTDMPDVPGWACKPSRWRIERGLSELVQLSRGMTHVAITYPNLGDVMTPNEFNDIIAELDDRFVFIRRN